MPKFEVILRTVVVHVATVEAPSRDAVRAYLDDRFDDSLFYERGNEHVIDDGVDNEVIDEYTGPDAAVLVLDEKGEEVE